MKIDKLKELVLILIATILIIFLIKYLNALRYLKIIFTVLVPVFIGFVYAWIFNPLVVKFSKKINRNIVCIMLFLVFIIVFGLFVYFVVPLFYKEVLELIEILPNFFRKIEVKVEVLGFRELLDQGISFIVNNVPKLLISLVSSVFKYIGIIVVGLILGLYISMDYEKIVCGINRLVPRKYKCVFINLSREVSDAVRKCVNGTLLIASFVFVLDSMAFFFIGIDSPILLGMICGITDLIPYVGPYIGGFAAVLVGLTESKILGILTLIVCVVVQSIENYVLQPIIMSKSIKISPILVIVSLLIFGRIFGIFGMILATPVLAILKVIFMYIKPVIKKCSKGKFDLKNG